MKRNYLLAVIFIFAPLSVGLAQSAQEELYTWSFDAPTIEKGYTVSTPDEQFNVGVLPGVLKGETDVTIKVFDHAQYVHREIYQVGATAVIDDSQLTEPDRLVVDWPLPEGKEIVSPVYEFDIKGAADLYNPERPLWLRFHYLAKTQSNLGVYFWDKGLQEWRTIPTENNQYDQSLRSAIHLTYAPMAILSDVIPAEGEASWYAYHGCKCAASRFYPNGTLLEVTDLLNGNSVIVEVNDYGPEEWTGRILDLDLVAFEALTEKWRGLTQVRVEPYLLTEEEFETQGLPEIYSEARQL